MTLIAIRRHPPSLQRYVLLVSMVSAAALASGGSRTAPSQTPREALVWRRTRDGWEQPQWLAPPSQEHAASLHPLLVAALVIGLSGMALLSYEPPSQNPTGADHSSALGE